MYLIIDMIVETNLRYIDYTYIVSWFIHAIFRILLKRNPILTIKQKSNSGL